MILVDTSYFLALVLPRDALFDRAQAWAKTVREPLLVIEYVVIETVNALSRPSVRPKVAPLLALIRSSPRMDWVPATTQWLEAGLQLHIRRPDQEWSPGRLHLL